MALALTILGSGPAEAIPRLGHRDELCRDARRKGSKSRRTRSSVWLCDADNRGTHAESRRHKSILIDCSPDFKKQVRHAHIKKIDAVFCTHAHRDAVGGLDHLARWWPQRQAAPPTIFAECRTITHIRMRTHAANFFRWREVTSGVPVTVGALTITPLRVAHTLKKEFPTLGFLIGRTCCYISDTKSVPAATRRLLKGVPRLILDAAFYFNRRRLPYHLTPDRAIRIATALRAQHLYLTQTGHTYPPHEAAEKEICRWWRKSKSAFPKSVHLCFDGMRITC